MKYIKYFLAFVLLLPMVVSAKDIVQEEKVVGEKVKYLKTVSVLNSSEVASIASPEILSITTEITKEEYDSVDLQELYHLNDATAIQTEYKILKTTMSENGSFYTYRVDLTWKNIPKVRSYDIIAIGHYSSVKPAANIAFNQSYCTGNGNCYDGAGATIITGDYGSAAVFSLPSGTLTNLTQFMKFNVQKSSSATVKYQTVAGDYAHAVKSITEANAKKFRVDVVGIIHNSSVESYYDSIEAAIVDWQGSW